MPKKDRNLEQYVSEAENALKSLCDVSELALHSYPRNHKHLRQYLDGLLKIEDDLKRGNYLLREYQDKVWTEEDWQEVKHKNLDAKPLSNEEFKEILDEMDPNGYFETPEFNSAFKIISRYKTIDQERISYGVQKIKKLSPKTFTKVCNAVFSSLEKKIVEEKKIKHGDYSGPGKYHVDYKGVRFYLMIGKGSS